MDKYGFGACRTLSYTYSGKVMKSRSSQHMQGTFPRKLLDTHLYIAILVALDMVHS